MSLCVNKKVAEMLNLMYRNFNAIVGRPFRVALLRVQTVARLKPCPTCKKVTECLIKIFMPQGLDTGAVSLRFNVKRRFFPMTTL